MKGLINLLHILVIASILCSLTKNIRDRYKLLAWDVDSKNVKTIMYIIITAMVVYHGILFYNKNKKRQ
jgi:hypothetical protein